MSYVKRRPLKDIFTFPMIRPRSYQMQAWKDYHKGIKNIIISLPRRSGKDVTSVCMAVDYALQHPNSSVVLMAPDRSWAKRIYWDKGQGMKVRDPITNYQRELSGSLIDMCLPECLRSSTNKSESKIYLKNGSTISLLGSAERTFVGMKINFLVISEAARHDPNIFPLLSPVMRESNGVTIYNGTVEDEINHFWTMIQNTKEMPDWSVTYLTAEHTKEYYWISPPEEDGVSEFNINPELKGKIHPETGEPYFNIDTYRLSGQSLSFLIREYLNIPTSVEEGSYYGGLIGESIKELRIADSITYNIDFPVFCAMDLGISDDSAIVWFQYIDDKIIFIDYYEKNNQPIEHFINVIRSKPYKLQAAFAPHDSNIRNMQTGMNLIDYCRTEYQFQFSYIPKTSSIISDIQVVRGYFSKMFFDKQQCTVLLAQLNRYHQKATTRMPEHGPESHAADAFRYAIMCIHKNLLSATQFTQVNLTSDANSTNHLLQNVNHQQDWKTEAITDRMLNAVMADGYDDRY